MSTIDSQVVPMIRGDAAHQLRAELERARAVVEVLGRLDELGLLEREAKKKCEACGKMKPLTQYYEHPHYRDGHKPVCIACERARQRERWKRKTDAGPRQESKTEPQQVCTKCGKAKSADEMCRGKRLCKACNAEYQRQWYVKQKKHACEICGKRFASIDTLTEHRKLRHS